MVAARGIEQAIRELRPGATVEVLDVLEFTSATFRWMYAQGYLGLVNHAPAAMGLLYEAMDRPGRGWRERLRTWFQTLQLRPACQAILDRKPALILCTHFLPAEIVSELRRNGRLNCTHAIVTTDFETHRMWAQAPAELYFTATSDGRTYLASWGAPLERIHVSGIPVRAEFRAPRGREAACAELGMDARRPVVLMLCGGFGVGPAEALFSNVLKIDADSQVVVITGRNEGLRRRLSGLAESSRRSARVLGYVDDVHLWMQAAHLVVTKPGGLTAAEALASGLPLVIVSPIPGQESRNSDYLLENGAAIKVNNARLLAPRIDALLRDHGKLERLRRACQDLARPQAALTIAELALGAIRPSVAETPAAPPMRAGLAADA